MDKHDSDHTKRYVCVQSDVDGDDVDDDDDDVDDDDVDGGERWCAIIVNGGQIRANAGAYSALLLWTPGRRKGKRPSGGGGQKKTK